MCQTGALHGHRGDKVGTERLRINGRLNSGLWTMKEARNISKNVMKLYIASR